jgi:hypothetical protein
MAIAKRPNSNQNKAITQKDEKAVEAFITGAAKKTERAEEAAESTKKTGVMIYFEPDLLKRIDIAAKKRGVSRSAWVGFIASKMLDQDEG